MPTFHLTWAHYQPNNSCSRTVGGLYRLCMIDKANFHLATSYVSQNSFLLLSTYSSWEMMNWWELILWRKRKYICFIKQVDECKERRWLYHQRTYIHTFCSIAARKVYTVSLIIMPKFPHSNCSSVLIIAQWNLQNVYIHVPSNF